MPWAILETGVYIGVYIGHWLGMLPGDALSTVRQTFIIRHSAVVLSEPRRGARTPQAVRIVEELRERAAIQ